MFLKNTNFAASRIKIYGHRGARGLAPENTLTGYRKALAVGVDYIDADVGMTADGVIVVTHDLALNPTITRDQKGEWIPEPILINRLTLEEIQCYNVGCIKPDSVYAKFFPEQSAMSHEIIPTLEQVIDLVNEKSGEKVGFQIEVKMYPTHPNDTVTPEVFAETLAKLLIKKKVVSRSEIQSFDWRVLLALQKIDPTIGTAYLTYNKGMMKMRSSNPQEAGLWTAGYLLRDFNDSIPQMIRALGGKIWGPEDTQLTEQELRQAHELGLKVVVWGYPEASGKVFDEKLVESLIKWKVDGIITDRPDELRQLFLSKNLDVPPCF